MGLLGHGGDAPATTASIGSLPLALLRRLRSAATSILRSSYRRPSAASAAGSIYRGAPTAAWRAATALLVLALLLGADLRLRALLVSSHFPTLQAPTLPDRTRDVAPLTAYTNDVVARFTHDPRRVIVTLPAPARLPDVATAVLRSPQRLVYLVRRCTVPCSFISTDARSGRAFTQLGPDHVWLDEPAASAISAAAHIALVAGPENVAEVATRQPYAVLLPPPEPPVYNHSSLTAHLQPAAPKLHLDHGLITTRPKLTTSTHLMPLMDPAVVIGFDAAVNISLNLASTVHGDLFAFRAAASAALVADGGSPPWHRRRAAVLAFLPPCDRIHAGALQFLWRLSAAYKLHVHAGGCSAASRTSPPPDHPTASGDKARRRLARGYRFVLLWEPGRTASAQLFRDAAGLPALPLVYLSHAPANGGAAATERLLPFPRGAALFLRDYAEDPEGLARRLRTMERWEWEAMMAWRDGGYQARAVNGTQGSGNGIAPAAPPPQQADFAWNEGLWERGVASVVCRLCEAVATAKSSTV
ncbi:hypothetical protein HK405_000421 [Cladochytrium tenue]|nr:hypothetical protein HK405_000421 [Cladochytrium tenue]